MSRHCSSVKSVGYDLSFIAPLPQNLTPTRRVNNSPDQMSRDNNCLKFRKPCNGHALRSILSNPLILEVPSSVEFIQQISYRDSRFFGGGECRGDVSNLIDSTAYFVNNFHKYRFQTYKPCLPGWLTDLPDVVPAERACSPILIRFTHPASGAKLVSHTEMRSPRLGSECRESYRQTQDRRVWCAVPIPRHDPL